VTQCHGFNPLQTLRRFGSRIRRIFRFILQVSGLTPLPPGSRGALTGLFAALAVYRARSHELGSGLTPLPPGSRGALTGLFAALAVYRARSHELGSGLTPLPPGSRGALSGLFAALAVYRDRSHELGSSLIIHHS